MQVHGRARQFWETNRRFVLACGGVTAAFAILHALVVANVRGATDETDRAIYESLLPRARDLYRDVERGSRAARSQRESLERAAAEVVARLTLAPPAPDRERARSPELYFNARIDEIWSALERRRSRESLDCELPPRLTTRELEIRTDDTPRDHARHVALLEIARRALGLLLDAGATRIDAIRVGAEERYPVRANPELSLVYRRLSIPVVASFQSIATVFRAAQRPVDPQRGGGLLQVFLRDLAGEADASERRSPPDPRGLNALLEFSLFSLEDDAVEAAADLPGGRR